VVVAPFHPFHDERAQYPVLPWIVEIRAVLHPGYLVRIGADSIAIIEATENGIEREQGKTESQEQDFYPTVFLQ